MKIFSALLDVVLIPVAIARDVLNPFPMMDGHDSYTRKKVEQVEEHLGL